MKFNLFLFLFTINVYGLETDQFSTWNQFIEDSTQYSNKMVNQIMDQVASEQNLNSEPKSCFLLAKALEHRMRVMKEESFEQFNDLFVDSYPKKLDPQNLWDFTLRESIYRFTPKDNIFYMFKKHLSTSVKMGNFYLGWTNSPIFF